MLTAKFIHANGKDIMTMIPTSPLQVIENGKPLQVIDLPIWKINNPTYIEFFSQRQAQMVGSITVFKESANLKDSLGGKQTLKNEALALHDTIIGEYKNCGLSKDLLDLLHVFYACFPEHKAVFPLEVKMYFLSNIK